MKTASMVINPDSYFAGYKAGKANNWYNNPYSSRDEPSKAEDFRDGYNDGQKYYNNLPRSFGMKVKALFNDGRQESYNNVTEVHYRHGPYKDCTAIESNIHGTGANILNSTIDQFEIFPQTELAESF